MNASRARWGGALVAALVVIVALIAAPGLRSLAHKALYRVALLVSPPQRIATGQPLGPVVVTKLDGSPETLRARPGRRLLINVFATWCVPCREETPALVLAARKLARDGIDVVGVDQAESAGSVVRYVQYYGIHYPTFIDPGRLSTISLDARMIPTTILVGSDNVVRVIHPGPVDENGLEAMTRQPG